MAWGDEAVVHALAYGVDHGELLLLAVYYECVERLGAYVDAGVCACLACGGGGVCGGGVVVVMVGTAVGADACHAG